jgi:hypothetical protein
MNDVQVSDVHVSDVQVSDVHVSDVQVSDVQVSDVKVSDVHVNDVQRGKIVNLDDGKFTLGSTLMAHSEETRGPRAQSMQTLNVDFCSL